MVRPGSFSRGTQVHRHPCPADLHRAFIAREDKTLALLAAIHKVDPKAQVEPLFVVKEPQHHVLRVASVVPIPQRPYCHALRRPMRSGHKVRPAEEMHKQVPRDTAPVGLPLAPLEETVQR